MSRRWGWLAARRGHGRLGSHRLPFVAHGEAPRPGALYRIAKRRATRERGSAARGWDLARKGGTARGELTCCWRTRMTGRSPRATRWLSRKPSRTQSHQALNHKNAGVNSPLRTPRFSVVARQKGSTRCLSGSSEVDGGASDMFALLQAGRAAGRSLAQLTSPHFSAACS
jgi:hypothetical protein